jgi:hypothetical protein
MSELAKFMLSFLFNFSVALIIVRWIYYPMKQRSNYIFTFLAFNTVVYFLVSLLTNVELSIGVGFGLFAIFSVLRYRTNPISVREMTYLFIILALPVMNSLLIAGNVWPEIIFANLVIMVVLFVLEKGWGFHYECSKKITYEKIELIKPENRDALLEDIRDRTGLPVARVEIGNINFLRDVAEIKIYYPMIDTEMSCGDLPDDISQSELHADDSLQVV